MLFSGFSSPLIHHHWWCTEHDISADGEEINEKSSTPVKQNSSLRTRRHHIVKREPTKDVNKANDDTVFWHMFHILTCCCYIPWCIYLL